MKYRSYNSELLIATTLMCDVFNDIIIDRRKHGFSRDYSKPITLANIVQQKIEVPCILGDRGIILKSLENEPGLYKLPLIIIQLKSLKTDISRVCDLHADVFYQQDSAFSELDEENNLYKPQELSKKRGQPISIEYDVTFLTKYREDLDQIISNFAVHFRPDIYLRWWHPRNKKSPLTSQLNWSQNISLDSSVDYNPQNVFLYKGTTSFTFKTWLFYGMHATDNAIDPDLEKVIKKIKFFTNDEDTKENSSIVNDEDDIWLFGDYENNNERQLNFCGVQTNQEFYGSDSEDENSSIVNDEDTKENSSIVNDEDDIWLFGDYENNNEGQLNFWGVQTNQEFYGSDSEKTKKGVYAVHNIFCQNHEEISGDLKFQKMKYDPLLGDMFSLYNKNDINNFKKYQSYLNIEEPKLLDNSFIKNVYFKGSFDKSLFEKEIPSGDYMFRTFFKFQKRDSDEKEFSSEFGQGFIDKSPVNIDYDIESKTLLLSSKFTSEKYNFSLSSSFNKSIYINDFSIESIPLTSNLSNVISYSLHKEYDKNLREITTNSYEKSNNINIINNLYESTKCKTFIENTINKNIVISIKKFIKSNSKIISLEEFKPSEYCINFTSPLTTKELDNNEYRYFKDVKTKTYDKIEYHILMNKFSYIILAIDEDDNCDIFDIGIFFPFNYLTNKALIYEITIPESKELLGLNFYLGI